jgi:hypothetical protein
MRIYTPIDAAYNVTPGIIYIRQVAREANQPAQYALPCRDGQIKQRLGRGRSDVDSAQLASLDVLVGDVHDLILNCIRDLDPY